MEVTEDMIELACMRDQATPITDDDRAHMRTVLSVALADVPEPAALGAAIRQIASMGAHLAELEATLGKVRKWRLGHRQWWNFNQGSWDDFDAILEGKGGG